MFSSEDLLTAYHEAGHAVIAMVVGRAVHRVSIVPNATRLGACELKKGRSRASNDELEDEVLVLLAGVAAEGRLTGQYNWSGGAKDLRLALQAIDSRASTEKQAERLRKRMLNKVEYLLDDDAHWAAIEVIANELVAHRTISGRSAKHHFDLVIKRFEKKT
jgi:ATP-dependent Zn protease